MTATQVPARYMVLIDTGGSMTALLFDPDRRQLAEFDAASEEVAVMARNLVPTRGADGPEWDAALGGSSMAERRSAEVYTLDL